MFEFNAEKDGEEIQHLIDNLRQKIVDYKIRSGAKINKLQKRIEELEKENENLRGMKEACERKLFEEKEKSPQAENYVLYELFKQLVDQNLLGEFLRRYDKERLNE